MLRTLIWRDRLMPMASEDFYFLVYTGNRDAYYFIPRRVFASEAGERSFRAILETHLPDIHVKPIRQRQEWVNLFYVSSDFI